MSETMRVLVLGASGMLGSATVRELAAAGLAVHAAARRPQLVPPGVTPIAVSDLCDPGELKRVFSESAPDAVVNCAGLIKQRPQANDPVAAIMVNALLPHQLSALCAERRARLIHVGTDCVFSGAETGVRGPEGYRETDPADAADIYGRSKLFGDVSAPNSVTLRMSLIGREPSGDSSGLVEWFLAARPPLRGYAKALFTGLTTTVAARLFVTILKEQPELEGIWHVAAKPISKLDLLRAMAERVRPGIAIEAVGTPFVDRRLDGSPFSLRTGWSAPSWPSMIDEMLVDT
jgi:dTDP-4-dehydrorhamnose reductase